MEKICVAIRVRPPTKTEIHSAKGHKWRVGAHNVALYSTLGTPINGQSYSFDHVFGTESKNGDIYRGLTKDVIMSAISGFNGTVFAYGQTSSGKTYTMKGTPHDPGIIRLAVHDVFSNIHMVTNREFLIRVSYMEIYNEEINDLFAPENRRLQIHENLEKGIFVAGLREEIVDSPEQVFNLLEFGESHRHFGETNMNLYSSRSHTIFRMVIESRDKTQEGVELDGPSDAVRVSALNMVDLAGSERIAKTGAGGVRLKEGTHINKSLMTLGTVINKLSDGTGKQGGHIPYRDSKLTRILQPALGGNARTAMICTVTPDEIHIDETRGTLQFASRAKRVTNCAQINEILTDAALLKRQTKEIEDLRMKLQGLPHSDHLEREILNLRNELLKFELEKERLSLELQEEKKAQVDRERRIKEQEQKIENLSTLFMCSNLEDRDFDKHKKINRRETWCPRQLNTELGVQEFSQKQICKQIKGDAMDDILYSMRRDRSMALPPAFESLVDEDGQSWNDTNGLEDTVPPLDFENIADEDTWMSLNKGHTTISAVFPTGFSERETSSDGSATAHKVALLENDLKSMQLEYAELKRSFDIKLEEATKDWRAEVVSSKLQLSKMASENTRLKNELDSQLEMQTHLTSVLKDVESEMDAARLLTSSMQGILADSLHIQAMVMLRLQDCTSSPLLKGRKSNSAESFPAVTAEKAKEKRALVESSAQRCRDICADIECALPDRSQRMEETVSEDRSGNLRAATRMSSLIDEYDNKHLQTRDAQIQTVLESVSAHDHHKSVPLSSETMYCSDCLGSLFFNSGSCSSKPVSSVNEDHLTSKCAAKALLDRFPAGGGELQTSGSDSSHISYGLLSHAQTNGVKAQALRALGPHPDVNSSAKASENQTADVRGPKGIWKEFISCPHVGCSFGTLGRNCENCVHHGQALIGENQIPTAVRNLCGNILTLLKPYFPIKQDVKVESEGGDVQDDKTGNLKARVASAKLLATWLLEEVQIILQHNVSCLRSHVQAKGNMGILLESLQVLLLENASLAVGLLQSTCQDELLMKELMVKLSELKDDYNNMASVADGDLKAYENPDQAGRQIESPPLPAAEEQIPVKLGEELSESSLMFPGRVLKLQGVEEMLGKVLEYSIGRLLSRKQQVKEGNTLLLVLNVGLQPISDPSNESRCWQVTVKKIEELGTRVDVDKIFSFGNGNHGSKLSNVENLEGDFNLQADSMSKGSALMEAFSREPLLDHCRDDLLDVRAVQSSFIFSEFRPLGCSPSRNCCFPIISKDWIENLSGTNTDVGAQLLRKVERIKELEVTLAAAELEAVELKVELEDLRAKMQTYDDTFEEGWRRQMELELESLRIQCENYEEEINLIMEQVPTPEDDMLRECQLLKIMEENRFLQSCLKKANKRLARSKASRTELVVTGEAANPNTIDVAKLEEDVTLTHSEEEHVGDKQRLLAGALDKSRVRFNAEGVSEAQEVSVDVRYLSLVEEVQALREQVASQEARERKQEVSVTGTGPAIVNPTSNPLDPSQGSGWRKEGTTRNTYSGPVRATLGELGVNERIRNGTLERRNPKRRRHLVDYTGESFANKENFLIFS